MPLNEDFSQAERDPLVDAEQCAVRLLAQREHSELEIARKLGRRGFESDVIAVVQARLIEAGYLSNQRYAEQYVRLRGERGYGPQRIRMELAERGLSDSEIGQALADDSTDWYAAAQHVYTKKYHQQAPVDYRERSKRMRFLQYRGFEPEHIQSVMEP